MTTYLPHAPSYRNHRRPRPANIIFKREIVRVRASRLQIDRHGGSR